MKYLICMSIIGATILAFNLIIHWIYKSIFRLYPNKSFNPKNMKLKTVLFSLATVILVTGIPVTASAQTNTIPPDISSQLPGGFTQLAADFGLFFKDAQPYFGTNGTTQLGAGVIYSNKKFGGFADIAVISLATNNQVTLGFTTAYLDGQWYDAGLSMKAGTTWQVPLIGPVYTWVETGPAYNFKAGHVLAQNFVGVMRGFNVGKVFVTPFAAVGNISDRVGLAYIFGVNANVKF